ncbi:hypothetical protein SAMN04488038_102134 [Solimonas aquatica]|uniref:HTH cro/C1-type domain-containing protein n=1 Tax=Solimonas aquatica TaxID=489703 RepID=A0A1H9BL22_9GAMM|nr:helix-turn-helix transcriptional regulator [Solimonas aquatica]SEP89635.1 hypothetical protein SAMN04488038_102134 [Solimonas aquatica]
MTNIAAVFKTEIARLSRKAIRQHLSPLLANHKSQKKEISALKQKLGALERELKQLRRGVKPGKGSDEAPATSEKTRFSAKGLRSLRARLDLSAEDFGRLIGASGQSVYKWEAQKATPRQAQVQKLAAIRSLGKREAVARLAALDGETA